MDKQRPELGYIECGDKGSLPVDQVDIDKARISILSDRLIPAAELAQLKRDVPPECWDQHIYTSLKFEGYTPVLRCYVGPAFKRIRREWCRRKGISLSKATEPLALAVAIKMEMDGLRRLKPKHKGNLLILSEIASRRLRGEQAETFEELFKTLRVGQAP